MSGYGRQATHSQPYIQHGLVYFNIKNGHAEPKTLMKELDLRTEESIE
jgi:hypothetical protein